MSSKCDDYKCEYNKPIMQSKCTGKKRAHSKFGKRIGQQVSGRCILGAFKRMSLCVDGELDAKM